MRNWICETYRLESKVHDNEWRILRHEVKSIIEQCVTELLAGPEGGAETSMR